MIRHVSTIHKDLSGLAVSVTPADNIPLNQYFDEESQAYIPDHTMIPLILTPEVQYEGEDVSAEYEERGWWRISASGVEQQITASTAGHTLYPTGYPLGLKISSNIPSGETWQYIFRVKSRGVRGSATVSLRTSIAASATPSLELDCPPSVLWDPFDTAHDIRVITPVIHARGKTCTLRWKRIVAGVRRAINPDSPLDFECSFPSGSGQTADGSQTSGSGKIQVNLRWMGAGITLVAELLVGSKIVDEKYVSFTRRIPPYRAEILSNTHYGAGDTLLYARALIKKEPGGGIISDPTQELRIDWYDCDPATPVLVGSGTSHDFPLDPDAATKKTGIEVSDLGPWKRLENGSGLTLTNADGKIIIARPS